MVAEPEESQLYILDVPHVFKEDYPNAFSEFYSSGSIVEFMARSRLLSTSYEEAKGPQRVRPDMSVRIPDSVATRLDMKVGTEIWIDILDEKLGQAVIGKRLYGNEAVKALDRLDEIVNP